MVIPMKSQYEQHCNAAALEKMGVPVIKSLKIKHSEKIQQWLEDPKHIIVNYPDETAQIIDFVLNEFNNVEWKKTDVPLTDFLKQDF